MADLTETVGRMWDQGRDTAEIARKLDFPEGEIERVLHRLLDAQHALERPANEARA